MRHFIATGIILALAGSAAHALPCDADLNHDGGVNGVDLGVLLSQWDSRGTADLDHDGEVTGIDLGILLAAWGSRCPGVIETELAGEMLTQYPFFEYATAFNAGSAIRVAIDPTRFPSIVGRSADIYIVANKTAAQWTADPALADLTPGGALAVNFSARDIQSNTFTADAGSLSAESGAGLGAPYDVVIDMNRNGLLDSGDFIDGFGGEGGLHVMPDLAAPGPYPVQVLDQQVVGVTPGFGSQRVFFSSEAVESAMAPLVIVSHGDGVFTWWDYLGTHLASHGAVVVAHSNNTLPGVLSASVTTFQHTDAFIESLPVFAAGVLDGRVDTDRIAYVGHGRGGEGVVIAYHRLLDGTFVPEHFGAQSIGLVVSIAPMDFQGPAVSNPHSVPFHLFWGAADGNVCGCPTNDVPDSFNLFERAAGIRSVTYIHGADHGDFTCCGSDDFTMTISPPETALGNAATQAITKSVLLALMEHHLKGNPAAKDYLARPYERFRAIGAPANATVVHEFKDGAAADTVAIDDFQTQPDPGISSSGSAVASSVSNLVEGLLNDGNNTFTWMASDPMNGMTRARPTDGARGVVFDWNGPAFHEWQLLPELRDLTDFSHLSFRAAQQTRHPLTIARLAGVTFNVTLRDGRGVSSTINIRALGDGVQEPYQRAGFGDGVGWQVEFKTFRIRLTDFLNNGSGVDLSDIEAVRLEFGAPGTSAMGRIGMDDVCLTAE